MDAVLGFLQVIRTMQDDAAADSRAPGRDLFKEEAVRRTVIINEDLLRIPPLEMVFQSFPQLVPQERSLGDLMEILPAVKFKAAGHLLRHGELAPVPSGHIRPGLHTLVEQFLHRLATSYPLRYNLSF